MANNNFYLLDCTLRDGGFVNDWRFGNLAIRSIVTRLDDAGIDIIEVGFLDSRVAYDKDRSMFPDLPSIRNTLGMSLPKRAELVAMIDYGNFGKDMIIPKDESVLDGIRLIFQKEDIAGALELAWEIKNQGYKLVLNPVALFSFRDKEILDLLESINAIMPSAISVVDTYGVMFWEDVVRYVYLIDGNIMEGIALGFHSHNNLQMSNSNCIELIKLNLNRKVILDSSILGMGKNSGNTCTELILSYADKFGIKRVDIDHVLECAYTDIQKFLGKQSWGYTLENLITATNRCSPNWTKYLMNKNTLSIANIRQIISTLPPYEKSLVSYFSNDLAEEKYLEFMSKTIDDTNSYELLRKQISGRDILMLCPGNSLKTHRVHIDDYIAMNNPVVFSVNFVSDLLQVDYAFVSNANRFSKVLGIYPELSKPPTVITTSNIVAVDRVKPHMQFNYKLLHDRVGGDNSSALLLSLLQSLGVKTVAVAGFDGQSDSAENYFEKGLELSYVDGANEMTVKQLRHVLTGENAVNLSWITPSRLEAMIDSLE